jgi:geranylgeranyl pyrophosphate synthase
LLLASGLEAASLGGRRVAEAFLTATRELSKRRLRDLEERPDWRRDPARDFTGVPRPLPRMLALAAELGAAVATLDVESTASAVAYGRALGWALELEHEARVWAVPDGGSVDVAAQRITERDFGLPVLIAATETALGNLLGDQGAGEAAPGDAIRMVMASSAPAVCQERALSFRREAERAIEPLPDVEVRSSLVALARSRETRLAGYD